MASPHPAGGNGPADSTTTSEAAEPPRPICAGCGDIIGVYEPLVRLIGGHPVETSRAAMRPERRIPGPLWHGACWQVLGPRLPAG